MSREFNTAGPCLAKDHYMIPAERRLSQVRHIIEKNQFFVIHAPRQTGKTTLLKSLAEKLNQEGIYAAAVVSLENFNNPDPTIIMPQLIRELERRITQQVSSDATPPSADKHHKNPHTDLITYLSQWASTSNRPVVLFLDEIDSIQDELLLSILRQLRAGYTARPAPFPCSVALVGLKDVRDYKIQVRPDKSSLGSASPFNIKSDSLTLRNFTADEVTELLEQHTDETGQRFESNTGTEIFHQTQGQPWLVNALAAQLTTRYDALVKDQTQAVTVADVFKAREILIERRDTHLDSLVDKLSDPRVRRVIEPMLTGELSVDPTYDDDFTYTRDLGLAVVRDGLRQIANPIYQEIIPRVLTHQIQTGIPNKPAWYVDENGNLNIPKLIDGFVEFWQENGEVLLKGMSFQEAAPHLVFMAYLQRIVNSGGRIMREFAVGTKRADLVVDFNGRKDVIELKLAKAHKALERGLDQVSAYAKRLGRDIGYLIIFDSQSTIPFEERGEITQQKHDEITITIVRA